MRVSTLPLYSRKLVGVMSALVLSTVRLSLILSDGGIPDISNSEIVKVNALANNGN
jgi:hypothetical protein